MNTLLKGWVPAPDAETHWMWGCKHAVRAGAALENRARIAMDVPVHDVGRRRRRRPVQS